ncbi:MAG: hypothetical protein GY946_03830, partial [bacterium]|nr:hypothetical protein [bacterium]
MELANARQDAQHAVIPRTGSLARWVALFTFSLCAGLLSACGGSGGGEGVLATDGTATDAVGMTLTSAAPTSVNALWNDSLRIVGEGFEAPVVVRFLDAGGSLLGSEVTASVQARGTCLEVRTPMLPSVEDVLDAQVEIVNGDGQRLMLGLGLRFEAAVEAPRMIDGSDNGAAGDVRGQTGIHLAEDVAQDYTDGLSEPSGAERPSARTVSNAVCAQSDVIPESNRASDMLWVWGQFLDHDITLTPEADPAESFGIPVPLADPYFDPLATGTVTMGFHRSTYDPLTGVLDGGPRRQINVITAWIDGSNVYGSDAVRAAALRANDGSGRMATSAGSLLPFNTSALPNAPTALDPSFFLAGDIRANEQVGLTAMHTLFVREHNRVADSVRADNPHLTGDELYEAARRYVVAELQVVTYREFLPLLLGQGALPAYAGYDATVDPAIGVLFSTACYRFGHTMVSGEMLRLDASGEVIDEGSLSVRDAFFNPSILQDEGGVEPMLRGLAGNVAQAIDPYVVDDLRNFLFGEPGQGGLDLASLNIQRGRDHALPDYNDCCLQLGLGAKQSVAAISSDAQIVARLTAAYDSPDQVDAWIGALSEDPLPGAMVGELLSVIIRDQFLRLRDGDRHWYANVFDGDARKKLERTRLSDIIRRNTTIAGELADDVFRVAEPGAPGGTPRPRPRRTAEELAA